MANPFLDGDTVQASKNPFLDSPPNASPNVPTNLARSAYRGVANTLYEGINDVGSAVGKVVSAATPQAVKDVLSKDVDNFKRDSLVYNAGKILEKSADKEVKDLSQYNTDLKPDLEALGKNVKAAVNLPVVKPVAELGMGAAGKALTSARKSINTKSDAMATKVPVDKEHAWMLKTLQKAGHSPEEIADGFKRAKEQGMTVGEAFGNPKILGMERKISGLNKPGGKMVRDFVKDRVDPANNVSMPYKLKSIADPLVKIVDKASKKIGEITENAPKSPVQMTSIESSLSKEARPPKSAVSNTLGRIDGLVDWAKSQGGTFADWHRVKQEIYNLKNEAKDPNAVEKLDSKTVNKYYKKVNDILSGKSPGLPKDLQNTAQEYRMANEAFSKNLAGRSIQEVLDKMPAGGTPASKLKYLHKQLAGNAELQEELFSGIPEAQRPGMVKLLEAIENSSRAGATDIVKSMEEGSPTFPFSKSGILHKMFDAVTDALMRKDYDALGKALTNPDAELIAKKLGYVKMSPPPKPVLRLTYQPKDQEIHVDRETEGKLIPRHEQALIDQARERLENLGIKTDHFRVQDMKTVQELEKKYGQSELGKFVIANRYTPFIDKAWEIPQKEYSQATVNRMMRDSAWDKLDEASQERINTEMEKAWNSHQVTLADMILSARQAAKELASAKGEPEKIGSVGNALLDAVDTGTPLENVIKQTQ